MSSEKVVPLEALSGIGGVLLHGGFDLVHYGHLLYFRWGKSLMPGATLTVTLTSDAHFPKYKGDHRPAFPENIRADWLSFIDIIDYIAIVHEPTGVLAIDTIKPAIYGKGWEANGIIPYEEEATLRNGGRVVYMEKESASGQIYSSGRILSGEYLRSRTEAAKLRAWPFPPIDSPARPRGVGEGDIGVE